MKQMNLESLTSDHGMMSREDTERILSHLQEIRNHKGSYRFNVSSTWSSDMRWARNRASMTSDRRKVMVVVFCEIAGGRGSAVTNQIDNTSLEGVLRMAERTSLKVADQRSTDIPLELPPMGKMPNATTWSDRTINRTVEESAKIVQYATSLAEEKQLLSAGYIESHGMTVASRFIDVHDRMHQLYSAMTQAQCSATVRHPMGTASGWAGLARYDLGKVDEAAIAARAVEKCVSSLDPVRIEPGRYTVILEPQAVADLILPMFESGDSHPARRGSAENSSMQNPFFMSFDRSVMRDISKIGIKIVDERITISHDPNDPELGILGGPGTGPVTWIDKGVLTGMTYDKGYAIKELNEDGQVERRMSLRMEGGDTSIDEMIAGTQRGLLVSRLSKLRVVDRRSLLMTGVTRDGLWLIEKGKISKSVRNFRISESPLFALNNVDQLGVPAPVYKPFTIPEAAPLFIQFALSQVIVPPLKVNDFSFTSTIDAI